MGFVILPASIPDIREVYDTYFAAFDGELVTQILFPWDIHSKEFRKGHADHTLEYWKKDNLQYTYKCIDTETDRIVGMSLWDFHWKERDEEKRKLPLVDWLQDEQKIRAQDFIRAFWERKEQIVGAKKHVYCHVVAVHPDYQKRGIGTMLTKPGLEVAEQLGVPVYLEATARAVKMYQNLGFKKLNRGVILEPRIAGGSETSEAPIMIKFPGSESTSPTSLIQEWNRVLDREDEQSPSNSPASA